MLNLHRKMCILTLPYTKSSHCSQITSRHAWTRTSPSGLHQCESYKISFLGHFLGHVIKFSGVHNQCYTSLYWLVNRDPYSLIDLGSKTPRYRFTAQINKQGLINLEYRSYAFSDTKTPNVAANQFSNRHHNKCYHTLSACFRSSFIGNMRHEPRKALFDLKSCLATIRQHHIKKPDI